MKRLHSIVEGHTEQAFIRDILAPHLAAFGVAGANPARFRTSGRRAIMHSGGLSTYARIRDHLLRRLREDHDPEARFTTMLDLYGLPGDFPGYAVATKRRDPHERVAVLERAFAEDIGDRRFLPFIQPHEFEALLFSDIAKFAVQFAGHRDEISRLRELAAGFSTPEHIDDEDPPARRIAQIIPRYRKPVDGPLIAAAIGLERIRAACPHFNEWLIKLEGLNRPPAQGDDDT